MDASWWWALCAVVLLALVAAVVDGRGRRSSGGTRGARGARGGRDARNGRDVRGPRGRTRPPGRPEGRRELPSPEPGEIWWADVPYEDGPGSKDRPCLVLSVHGATARVAKITSRRHDGRPGVIPLPPGTVGDALGRTSFLESDELRTVRIDGFRRRVGTVDRKVWARVRRLSG
ncbi:type II toxin-antitoxin system PemK/MazF family toxin [Streptomyces sp. NPDC004838]